MCKCIIMLFGSSTAISGTRRGAECEQSTSYAWGYTGMIPQVRMTGQKPFHSFISTHVRL